MHKLWTLQKIIEDAKVNDKNLHTCYLDIMKAYDYVEHWGLFKVLKMYGFSKKFRNIIKEVCLNTTTQIITPHGLTKNINVGKGVHQGCPLSPLLFILFLDPLLLWLADQKIGYEINGMQIPALAFADDMALTCHSKTNMQKLINTVQKYLWFFGLELAVDGRDKSVYTSNNSDEEGKCIFVNNIPEYKDDVTKGKRKKKPLPFFDTHESYKYLGVWINLDLDWTDQFNSSQGGLIRNLTYLRHKCFTPSQTAEIINIVVLPAITYRMNIVSYPKDLLTKWDKWVKNLMAYKLQQKTWFGCKHWYLPNYESGYNVFKLTDMQKIYLPTSYINYALNGIDRDCSTAAETNIDISIDHDVVDALLSSIKLKVEENPALKDPFYVSNISHFIKSDATLEKLEKAGIKNIQELFNQDHRIQSELFFDALHVDKKTRNKIIKETCTSMHEMKPYIKKILEIPQNIPSINPYENQFFYDNQLEAYEAFVDETENDGQVGYGVFFKKNSMFNFFDRVYGFQTIGNATLQAIEQVLVTVPLDAPFTIYIDRESICKLMNKLPLKQKDIMKVKDATMIKKITELLKERQAPTYFKHIYSHLKVKGTETEKQLQKKNKRLNIMLENYGQTRTMRLIEGNHQADRLAANSLDLTMLNAPEYSIYEGKYVLKSTREKASKKDDFKGHISENLRGEIKMRLRKEYAYGFNSKKFQKKWRNNETISPKSWALTRSKKYEHEWSKKQMIRMHHNDLPQSGRLYHYIEKEKAKNWTANKPNTFWQDQFEDTQINPLCSMCHEAVEKKNHLFYHCTHHTVTGLQNQLPFNIADAVQKYTEIEVTRHQIPIWYKTNTSNNNNPNKDKYWKSVENFDKELGSMGFIPKKLPKFLQDNFQIPNNKLEKAIASIQHEIMSVNREIWLTRCKHLFANKKATT
jgi:hypothetical protein